MCRMIASIGNVPNQDIVTNFIEMASKTIKSLNNSP